MEAAGEAGLSEEGLVAERINSTEGLSPEEGESSSVIVDGEENEENIAQSLETKSEESPPVTTEIENGGTKTSEGEATNESDATPSMTSLSSLGKSDSSNEEDSSDNHYCTESSSKVPTLEFSSNWSESLKSPADVLKFSPSEVGSCHGIGLKLAVEKNVATSIFLGNILVFFMNTGALYEQLGMNLIKMTQFVHPQQIPPGISMHDDFATLYEDLVSLAGGFRSLGKFYRLSIVAPLKKMLSRNGGQRDAVLKQYRERKQSSVEARKLALANHTKLKNATKIAEDEVRSWYSTIQKKESQVTEGESAETEAIIAGIVESDSSWEKALKLIGKRKGEHDATIRLIKKLKLIQSSRTQYNRSIDEENNFVILSQESEALALTTTQKSEEDQMKFFVKDILSQVFPADKNGENLTITQTNSGSSDADGTLAENFEKKLLSGLKLFQQGPSLSYEEGMGVMDAETLGLPETLGAQRDKIKSSFSSRENRMEVTEVIIKLFEEINGLTSKSSLRMINQVSHQRRQESTDESNSESFYSSIFGSLWRETLSVFEDEAKLISGMAFRVTKLEKWLALSKRTMENEKELDDAAWRRVCDAARVEMRLEMRYMQTKQNVEKIRQRASSKEFIRQRASSKEFPKQRTVSTEFPRQRASSKELLRSQSSSPHNSPIPQRARVDSSPGLGFTGLGLSGIQNIQNTPNKFGRAFFKGGEAMKKLTENAMSQIVQIGVNDADQKETKDQLAYEEACAEKKSAIAAYESRTKDRIEKLKADDEAGWAEMKEIIVKLAGSINELKKCRSVDFQCRISQEVETSLQPLAGNMQKWSNNVQEKIQQSKHSSSRPSCSEYSLSVQTITSESIDPLFKMVDTNLTLPDLNLSIEATKESNTPSTITKEVVAPPSGADIKGTDDGSDNEADKTQRSLPAEKNTQEPVSGSGSEKSTVPKENATSDVTKKEESPDEEVKEENPQIKAFMKQFWSKKPKDEKPPKILDIIPCAYRPKERASFLLTNLYGNLYTTKDAIYFLASNKNFTLRWERITSVEKEKGFMGTYNETELVISYRSEDTIAAFLLCRMKDRDGVVEKLQTLKAESEESKALQVSKNDNGSEPLLPPVPPDALQKKMDIVVSKTIKNVSIKSVFEKVWADLAEDESFYESWLKEEECFDVGVGEWEIAENGKKFKNEWCNEEYDQQRLVTFKFNRTTHLYIGPPVAIVKQRHFIRVEDDDRCVLAISAEFEGIPYADTFAVEMRWVAARTGRNDVLVKVGLFVNFKKTTMMKSQIKSGTITETKSVHLRLFDAVKKACTVPGDSGSDNDNEEEEEEEEIESSPAEPKLLSWLGQYSKYMDSSKIVPLVGVAAMFLAGRLLTRALFGNSGPTDIQRLENTVHELRNEVRALHETIDSMTLLLKDIKSNSIQYTGE